MQLIGIGGDFQACPEFGQRAGDVALLQISHSEVLVRQRVVGILFQSSQIKRNCILRFSRLHQREAEIGQGRRVMGIVSYNLLKQRNRLLLLPSSLESKSKLVLRFERIWGLRQGSPQNGN